MAVCSGATPRVLGGGFRFIPDLDRNALSAAITESYPSSPTTWTVTADDNGISRWSLQAYAICAP